MLVRRDEADAPRPSIDPSIEAHPRAERIASELVASLCHVPGELPAFGTLAEIIAPSASIVEEGPEGSFHYGRDDWFRELTSRAVANAEMRTAWFVDELDRITVAIGSEASVYLICVRRLTRHAQVLHSEIVRCSVGVERIGDAPRVVRLIMTR